MNTQSRNVAGSHRLTAEITFKRRLPSLLGATGCLVFALTFFADSYVARAQTGQSGSARFLVETKETSTFFVGREGKVNFVLLDENGLRVDAPYDLQPTITITTLDSLSDAKKFIASKGANQQMSQQAAISQNQRITFKRGQVVSQSKYFHRKGEEDEEIRVLSHETGRLHIYVEFDGIATGETVVVVLGARRSARKAALLTSEPSTDEAMSMAMPVLWQQEAPPDLKLGIMPTKPNFQIAKGEQLAYFKVELMSALDGQNIAAPEDITVFLKVTDGYARFEPDTLLIHKDEAISREQSALRTRPGGTIAITASAKKLNGQKIIPFETQHEFVPGIRCTNLSIQKQRESALANGLDEIELRVEALYEGRAITPEDEGMDDRVIFFSLIGDSEGVRFENNKAEVQIPRGKQSGTIKLFSTRPVSDLKVVAESWNGLRQKITTENSLVPVRFSFPWLQLLCAMVGGALFPILRARTRMEVAQGVVIGAVFFGLALFGAIASNPQNIGFMSIALTKLPTENFFASFVLGFLSVTIMGVILKGQIGEKMARALVKAQGR